MSSHFHAVADVTSLVQSGGSGAYTISNIDTLPTLLNLNVPLQFAAWWMVVFYTMTGAPLRALALADGLALITYGNPHSLGISGFTIPTSGISGKLGIVAFAGDALITSDQFHVNRAISDALNPTNNFFDSTHSYFGTAGDLPQLSGEINSMSGFDLDVVDITSSLVPGETSISTQALSTGDIFYIGALIVSLDQ